MNLMTKAELAQEVWEHMNDPKAIREAFEADQLAEDEQRVRRTYRVTEGGELEQEKAA